MSVKLAKTYFAAQPCVRGHVAPRYIRGNGCTQCLREYDLKRKPTRKIASPHFRKEASNLGSRFYQGADCKYYHGGIRRTSSGECIDCERKKARLKYRRKNPVMSRSCIICKGDFVPITKRIFICSTECRLARGREKKRKFYDRLKKRGRHKQPKKIQDPGLCSWCGAGFIKRAVTSKFCCVEHQLNEHTQRADERRKKSAVALRALEELGIQI
jgi:hypothetical protein